VRTCCGPECFVDSFAGCDVIVRRTSFVLLFTLEKCNFLAHLPYVSRGTSVIKLMIYALGVRSSNLLKGRSFTFRHHKAQLCGSSAFLASGCQGLFFLGGGVKLPEFEAYHSATPTAEVNIAWDFASFMT
jgi:hypothetical protein